VPGWGAQLPVDRVLSEMQSLGLRATELGSVGYLPTDPHELSDLLNRYDMQLTGGFNALALADPDRSDEMMARAEVGADLLAAAGATYFVTCPVADPDDWTRPDLDDAAWRLLVENLDRIDHICAARGLQQALHPHVDSLVETADEITRMIEMSDVGFVLETGHMLIGGFDPLRFARECHDRVVVVHLKDVASEHVGPLNQGDISLMDAVQAGIFPHLGGGVSPIADCVIELEQHGYSGWYIIEQDAAITDGFPAEGDGPVRDVRESVAFLQSVKIGSDVA
jgi:inosose dehydratase